MFGLKEQDIAMIRETLKKESSIEEAIVYGSRAKGNFKPGSDVDLCLKGFISYRTVLDISAYLNEKSLLPYFFDVSAYNDLNNQNLIEHINRVGILIYKKEEAF